MKNFIALFFQDLVRANEGIIAILFTMDLQPFVIADWVFNTYVDPNHTSRLYKMILSTFAIEWIYF